jgi:hypothetical protein
MPDEFPRDRYAPEFDDSRRRPVMPSDEFVGITDDDD